MKRTWHGSDFQGDGTKSHLNHVIADIFQACEFHEYALTFNRLITTITNEITQKIY